MKFLSIITLLLSTSAAFGQIQNSPNLTDLGKVMRYVVGDRIIECQDCRTDFCGNLINAKGDTVALNTRPFNSNDNPLYLTNNKILLSTKTVKKLVEEKKVKLLTVIKCNNGRQVFGDIAKNGIIIIELIDEYAEIENLEDYLSKISNGSNSKMSAVYINGLLTTDKKLKVAKGDSLQVVFDRETNSYNIKTE